MARGEEEKGRTDQERGKGEGGGTQAKADPFGSQHPFFIRDFCFIWLSERDTRFPSSPQ